MDKGTIKFAGPAQKKFSSLEEQEVYFMEDLWPHWNNYDEPESYVVSTRFSTTTFHEERILFGWLAGWLAKKRIAAPFMAFVRNRYFKPKELHRLLPVIWPRNFTSSFASTSDELSKLHECSFVIGPKIGIIVISILAKWKGSWKQPQAAYRTEIKLLKLAKHFVSSCFISGTNISDSSTKLLLFAPYLDRREHEKWIASLDSFDKAEIEKETSGVIQLFKDDYATLQNIFENCEGIPVKVYEQCASAFAALESVVVVRERDTPFASDDAKFAVTEERSKSAPYIPQLHSDGKLPSAVMRKAKSDMSLSRKSMSNLERNLEGKSAKDSFTTKVVFLNDDQRHALNGPRRQIIIGAAGTGKTTVLLAKAVELLERGQSVTILAPRSCMHRYKSIFDNYDFANYKICCWPLEIAKVVYNLLNYLGDLPLGAGVMTRLIRVYVEKGVREKNEPILTYFAWVMSCGNMIVDGAFDEDESGIIFPGKLDVPPLLLMVVAKLTCPENLVWVALDPQKHKFHNDILGTTSFNRIMIVYHEKWRSQYQAKWHSQYQYFSTAFLRRVMHCTESIFSATYHNSLVSFTYYKFFGRPLTREVSLGHKIVGQEVIEIKSHGRTFREAFEASWCELQKVLKHYFTANTLFSDIGVITSTINKEAHLPLSIFLREKCRKEFPGINITQSPWNKFTEIKAEPKLVVMAKEFLVIEDWDRVSSLEWPVVIYISCSPAEYVNKKILARQRYCARSRATAELIEISLTYQYDDIELKRSCQKQAVDEAQTRVTPSFSGGAGMMGTSAGAIAKAVLGGVGVVGAIKAITTLATMIQLYKILNQNKTKTLVSSNESAEATPIINGWTQELAALRHFEHPQEGPLEIFVNSTENPPETHGHELYHNCTRPKGLALVISNDNFLGTYPNRPGSIVDSENVTRLLEGLGYAATRPIHRNLTADEIQMVANDFSAECDSAGRFDSYVVYLSTYAVSGEFIGADGKGVAIESFFNAVLSSIRLTRKPKIFIIQACRKPAIATTPGAKITPEEIRMCEWKAQEDFLFHLPDATDLCILHSVTPGYYTWCKGPEYGSWFIQALCETLAKHAWEPWADLSTLITMINSRLHDVFKEQRCLLLMNATLLDMGKVFHFLPGGRCPECEKETQEKMETISEQEQYLLQEAASSSADLPPHILRKIEKKLPVSADELANFFSKKLNLD